MEIAPIIDRLMAWLGRALGWQSQTLPTPQNAPVAPVSRSPAPAQPSSPKPAPETVPKTVPESEKLSFDTQRKAFHAVRVICDELGLSVAQKNLLCACIYQESRFLNRYPDGTPVTNPNKDKRGNIWSTDYGLVQVNDYYHCGKGKTFPSVNYVMNNPEKVVRWMAGILKSTGKLQPWASFTSGAYRKWLASTSPMWALKT